MATFSPTQESPAQTMLRIERQNIARTGEATPSVAVGPITRQGNASTLPTGFGADMTNKIFRYDGSGNQNPTPAIQPPTAPTKTTPSGISGLNINGVLTRDQFDAQGSEASINEAAIRDRVRTEQQARIDAVNAVYDDMVRRQMNVNEGNQGSTRAINARSGLIGSDFGAANDANQRAAGQQAVDAVNRERGLQISSIYAKIDEDVQNRVSAEKAAAQGKANEYKSYLEKAQGEAKARAVQLGASGMSFDQLKQEAPDQLKKLLESSGMDEFTLALTMNTGKPVAEKIDYKTSVVGNRVVAYGVNPATGQLETMEKELPEGAQAKDVRIVGGELWSVSGDGSTATRIGGNSKPLIEQIGSGRSMRKVISYDGGKSWKDLTTGAAVSNTIVSSGGGNGADMGGATVQDEKKIEEEALQAWLLATGSPAPANQRQRQDIIDAYKDLRIKETPKPTPDFVGPMPTTVINPFEGLKDKKGDDDSLF